MARITFGLIVVGLFGLYIAIPGRPNQLYASIHIVIIVLSLLHITRVRRFNLGLSFSLFMLFFFGFIPLFEYKLGITYNGMATPADSSYFATALLALLACVCFYLGYGVPPGQPTDASYVAPQSVVPQSRRSREVDAPLTVIMATLTALSLVVAIAAYYGFAPIDMLFRGYAEEVDASAFGYSFVNYFLRPLLFNLIFLVMLSRKMGARGGSLRWMLFIGLLLAVSPIGIPRSLAGALYIPLLTMVFMPRLNSKYGLLCLVVLGVLVVAPVFDIFRVFQLGRQLDLGANFNIDYLFAGHFDAFFNFVEVIESRYVSAGFQVIGALLFWIPRAIWPNKPIGTSFDLGAFAGYRESNVSFPLPADLYVDYGVVGLLLGMYLLGLIYRRLDRYLSKPREAGSVTSYICSIAQLELSILGLYLLRGNFLSSFSFTMGVASSFAILWAATSALRLPARKDGPSEAVLHEQDRLY